MFWNNNFLQRRFQKQENGVGDRQIKTSRSTKKLKEEASLVIESSWPNLSSQAKEDSKQAIFVSIDNRNPSST